MEITDSLFLPIGNKQGELPKRIQLLPGGSLIEGRDGRRWEVKNSDALIQASNSWLPNHPIDENHSIDLKAPQGEPSPAFGWFNNITKETNGEIWADVEWTKDGAEAVTNLKYRYLSPVFLHNEKGEITTILRAGLHNSPNLQIKSLNSQMPGEPAPVNTGKENHMDKILAALGLAETATEDEILKKIAELQALAKAKEEVQLNAAQSGKVDLAAYAPRADLVAMETRAKTAEAALKSLNASQLKTEGEAVVDQAVKDRKIAPASKAEYLSLCSTKEGIETFRKIMASSPAVIPEGSQVPAGTPPASGAGSQVSLNAEESSLAKQMGYTEEEWKKIKEKGK